jgi:ATP-dependent helicase/nuclease subunit A
MAELLHFPSLFDHLETVGRTVRPEGEPPPADAATRAVALDTRSSCIVEAPAGSGKTGLLVQRFLKLLAGADIDRPEEVLAMTFTRKATAEMQQRVLEHLHAADTARPLESDSPFARETRALAKAVLARGAQLGWDILAQPQRLNIRSILSVCLEIANSLPLLSGGAGPREPIEDAAPLHRLAARRTLLQLGGPDQPLHRALRTLLLHRDGSLAEVEKLLADMLDKRDQWGELIPLDEASLEDSRLDAEVRPKLERALESIVCSGLSHALHAMSPHALHQLTTLAARLGHLPGYRGAPSRLMPCAGLPEPPEATAGHLDRWTALIDLLVTQDGRKWRSGFNSNHVGLTIPKADKALLLEIIAEINGDEINGNSLREILCAVRCLPPARYPDEQWVVARALFRVLRHGLVELKMLFSERGQCDYTELSLAACQALRGAAEANESADLALAAGGRLRHLLVDEMQDTSATQYELIRLLTSSWDGHSQTLFLVGDPKQSIYLFRQARVERFLRTLADERLGTLPLQALRLTANFRSQGALVEAFNHTFGADYPSGRIFAAPAQNGPARSQPPNSSAGISPDQEVIFVAASATRAETIPDAIVWHTTELGANPISSGDAPAGDDNAAEARTIRRLIEDRLAVPLPEGRNDPRKPKPWRIAVLARAHNHLSAIVQELKAHDGKPAIPFRAVDLDPLDQVPEVLDALALTRALLHPADRVAWLAVLRAPWCGLALSDLLALTGDQAVELDTPGAEAAATPDPAAPASSAADARATVAALVRTRRQHLSPTGQHLLERTWPTLEAAVATLGRTPLSVHVERTWRSLGGDAPLTPEQQSNVLRFLAVLRELEPDPGLVALDLLNVLTARLKKLYAAPMAGTDIQVELLTIHKAKGLEWDVVLVPGLHRTVSGNRSPLLDWIELDNPSAEQEASILLAPIAGKGAESCKLNEWLRRRRSSRERAEEKRLFYVAATRAQEQLHLFAALARKADGALEAPRDRTLLKACWPAAAAYFEGLTPADVEPRSPHALTNGNLTDGNLTNRNIRPFPTPPPSAYEGLELAASAASSVLPDIARMPLSFQPGARFAQATQHRLPYAPASAFAPTAPFARPEGSFAVRAFGNVVHRYLQVLAGRLSPDAGRLSRDASLLPVPAGAAPLDHLATSLLAELPSWEPRLYASLRGEGLPPSDAAREATRALRALTLTLSDPVGHWILGPHASAASEQTLTLATQPGLGGSARSLRIDRTFVSGPTPLSSATGCIWIVDFKTAEPGSRSPEAFAAAEIATYSPQLEAYAALRRSLPGAGLSPLRLGLFYPLIPKLLHWPSATGHSI